MTRDDDLDAPVTRREFETELGYLRAGVDRIEKALAGHKPGLGNLITLGTLAIGLIVTGVQNFTRLSTLERWADDHQAFSSSKSAELDTGISDMRSRMRSTEKAIEEQEMQHRWMADVANLQVQRLEREAKLPPSDYWPLGQIGQATTSGDKE